MACLIKITGSCFANWLKASFTSVAGSSTSLSGSSSTILFNPLSSILIYFSRGWEQYSWSLISSSWFKLGRLLLPATSWLESDALALVIRFPLTYNAACSLIKTWCLVLSLEPTILSSITFLSTRCMTTWLTSIRVLRVSRLGLLKA